MEQSPCQQSILCKAEINFGGVNVGDSADFFFFALAYSCVTWVPSLGQEDPLEEDMATHSVLVAQRIPWTEKLGGLQSMGLQRVRHN